MSKARSFALAVSMFFCLHSSASSAPPAANSGVEGAETSKIDKKELSEFLARTHKKIMRNWYPPKCGQSVSVRFTVNENGDASNVRIIKSQGLADEEAARRAVKLASPFQKLPAGCGSSEDFDINFDFTFFEKAKVPPMRIVEKAIECPEPVPVALPNSMDKKLLESFLDETTRRILLNWHPSDHKKTVLVRFNLNRKGEVEDARIVRSSGDKVSEEEALKALKEASPLRKLPPGAKQSEPFEFAFNLDQFGKQPLRYLGQMK